MKLFQVEILELIGSVNYRVIAHLETCCGEAQKGDNHFLGVCIVKTLGYKADILFQFFLINILNCFLSDMLKFTYLDFIEFKEINEKQ